MQYQIVFDINQVGFKPENAVFGALGLLFICIGLVFILFRNRMSAERPVYRLLPFCFLIFAVAWTIAALGTLYAEYAQASDTLRSGHASVVEGRVVHFIPMPATERGVEQFCVRSTCFKYSDYVATAGFNRTSTHGGPIREGLPVRVTYLGNTILRLEIAVK